MADTIPNQSSYCLTNNGSCSTSTYCACATVVTGERICTQQMSCEYGTPCLPDNTCAKAGSACVLDPRCDNTPLCYSYVIFSPDLCPPLPVGGDDKKKK